jgi:hypothetical protein
MHPSRRKFLKKTMLAAMGTTLFSQGVFAGRSKKVLGLQLYSVRDDMKKNPVETLKQVAAIGYRNVEHANYVNRKFYGFSAAEFKKLLDGIGLNMISGHTSLSPKHWDAEKKDFTDEWKWTVEDAAILGQHYVVSPWLDESLRNSYDGLMQFLDIFNNAGNSVKNRVCNSVTTTTISNSAIASTAPGYST